jgi:hypothetical protein
MRKLTVFKILQKSFDWSQGKPLIGLKAYNWNEGCEKCFNNAFMHTLWQGVSALCQPEKHLLSLKC